MEWEGRAKGPGGPRGRRRRLAAAGIVVAALVFLVVVLATDPFEGSGDDEGDAEQVVRDFVTATSKRDSDKLCDELLTEEFIEQATGATGDQARDACKQQLKATRGLTIELRSIRSTEVEDDEATVVAVVTVQGQDQPRTFRLKKEEGDWRLAGGAGSGE
jgi:Domain of unknown function (DUF4878)